MQQFFAEPSWITESEILIRGADLNHMKNVLRMKVGEDVRINDGQGTTYLCCLNRYEKDQAVLDVFRKLDTETELPSEIILFQGLPKGDKMEWIVQKSVELGAHKIVPFSAKRSVVKLDEKKAVKKLSITHLPQIAAMADSHYRIEKVVKDGKTITQISKLDREESVLEIARLLGGAEITNAAVENARDMKELADKAKIH